MNSLFAMAFMIVSALVMILALIVLVSIGAWYLIYYVFGCTVAPIQKTVVTAAVIVWVVLGAITSLL